MWRIGLGVTALTAIAIAATITDHFPCVIVIDGSALPFKSMPAGIFPGMGQETA